MSIAQVQHTSCDTEYFLGRLLALCGDYRQIACLTLTAIHPDGEHHTPSRHIPLNRPALMVDALTKLLEINQQGWGAYFAVGLRQPGLTRYRRGGKADVIALPALHVDLDLHTLDAITRLRSFSPRPSCIVNSGGGLHAYWWLEQPTTDLNRAEVILRALSDRLNSDRTTVAQSMRLPGSLNTKPTRNNAHCHIIDLNEQRYTLADFAHLDVKPDKPCTTVHTVHRNRQSAGNRQLNPRLIQAVTEILYRNYCGYSKSNGYIAALCPCGHQHDAPGKHFNFDPEHGVGVCFGRHGRLLLKDICTEIGIYPADYGGLFL